MRGGSNTCDSCCSTKASCSQQAALKSWDRGLLEMRDLLYVQLAQAVKVAHMRGAHTVNMEDIMFLLRKDKVYHKCFTVCITAIVV